MKLKKELGLLEGVAIIIGIIVGSGSRQKYNGKLVRKYIRKLFGHWLTFKVYRAGSVNIRDIMGVGGLKGFFFQIFLI